MLKQKPEIGDTLVCRNGERFTCCAVADLREVQQHWAQKYLDESGGYLGMYGSDNWMHWTPMLRSRTANPEWDVVEITPVKCHFSPQIGDTIVTAERGNYICVIADGAHLTEEQGKTMYLIVERLKRSVLMSDENMSELTIQDVLQHCMETLDEQLKSEGL